MTSPSQKRFAGRDEVVEQVSFHGMKLIQKDVRGGKKECVFKRVHRLLQSERSYSRDIKINECLGMCSREKVGLRSKLGVAFQESFYTVLPNGFFLEFAYIRFHLGIVAGKPCTVDGLIIISSLALSMVSSESHRSFRSFPFSEGSTLLQVRPWMSTSG